VRLVLNAVTAMPEGGAIAIRASSEESGWVVIEVRDTGVGMAPALRERLRQRPPTGRGLAEVFETVERHGGTVGLDSEEGKGTAVRLRLHASRFQIIPPSPQTADRGRPSEEAVRLLIVDDDPRLLAVLSDVLKSEGHEVTTATSGESALELFDPRLHDVVMTDLGMPRMTGWEVAERVKRRSPETAVFILTGWGETVSAHESSQFVDRVIAKPVSAESLLDQLAELRRVRPPA
jgi:CheY-like chemotaxis protein